MLEDAGEAFKDALSSENGSSSWAGGVANSPKCAGKAVGLGIFLAHTGLRSSLV